MRIISEDNFFRLGLREVLKIHDAGLREITISLSSDLNTIRLYKNVSTYSNERYFILNCLAGFILSHQLSDGLTILHHNLFKLIAEEKTTYLTPREIDVMRALLKGNNVTDISRLRGLSPKTISAQKSSALRKLKVSNLTMLHRDLEIFKSLFYNERDGHKNADL
ncbi:helix-turn-helix domain-containing protein [Pantoea anthophila]|uniref:helix-turn-helix domain-containing protein n=1 Tax=Pantoea anthophila TaxID=470931 RepID=UPI0027834C0D|nr:LuxR C-terminal-related transcriptional regulator [Pantoea anthophila]MDQ1214962.1 DNA-binding CsgD family transcriptional regulator [Pantoea anthophila]